MNYELKMNNRSLDIAVQSYILRIMAKYVGWWFFHHSPLDGGNLYGTGVSAGVSSFGSESHRLVGGGMCTRFADASG